MAQSSPRWPDLTSQQHDTLPSLSLSSLLTRLCTIKMTDSRRCIPSPLIAPSPPFFPFRLWDVLSYIPTYSSILNELLQLPIALCLQTLSVELIPMKKVCEETTISYQLLLATEILRHLCHLRKQISCKYVWSQAECSVAFKQMQYSSETLRFLQYLAQVALLRKSAVQGRSISWQV